MNTRPLFSLLITTLMASPCMAASSDDKISISGRIVDESSKPVPNVLVVIRDKDQRVTLQTHSDKNGWYEVMHLPSKRCSVHVVPNPKTGFAQATLPDVSAEEGRHFVVSIHHGFKVHGQVTYDGKPVKGATVYATDTSDTIHGGGETVTDAKGNFLLVLTPGEKLFEAAGPRGSQLNHSTVLRRSVSTDTTIDAIPLIMGESRAR